MWGALAVFSFQSTWSGSSGTCILSFRCWCKPHVKLVQVFNLFDSGGVATLSFIKHIRFYQIIPSPFTSSLFHGTLMIYGFNKTDNLLLVELPALIVPTKRDRSSLCMANRVCSGGTRIWCNWLTCTLNTLLCFTFYQNVSFFLANKGFSFGAKMLSHKFGKESWFVRILGLPLCPFLRV